MTPKETTFDKTNVPEKVKNNPRRRVGDILSDVSFIRWLKLRSKEGWFKRKGTLENEIIPRTSKHGRWDLGAELLAGELKKKREASKSQGHKHIRFGLVTDREMVKVPEDSQENFVRLKWFDHGTLDVTTGKNQTVADMRKFQEGLYNKTTTENADVYCHCMAGRSRSYFATIAYMHFHPNQKDLFDFDSSEWKQAWDEAEKNLRKFIKTDVMKAMAKENSHLSKKELDKKAEEFLGNLAPPIVARIEDLKKRLSDNPSISDIAEFTQLRRPKVKPLEKLEGDQAGLLGLMALSKMVDNNCKLIVDRPSKDKIDIIRLLKDGQNVGMMLAAPLDHSFRDSGDLKEQEDGFKTAYQAFQKKGVNLLMAMVVSIEQEIDPDRYNTREEFEKNFVKLKPSEQARLAIFMRKLEAEPGIDLSPFKKGDALRYAEAALVNGGKKLTAGDQVELLRSFGPMIGLGYKDVVNKILDGNKVDRYNAGIQLAELVHLTKLGFEEPAIEKALKSGKLNQTETKDFLGWLQELKDQRVDMYTGIVNKKPVVSTISQGEVATKENRPDLAFKQFEDWFQKIKGSLTAQDKQLLVKQFMMDPEKQQAGDPARLLAVLRVCSKADLGNDLYGKLKTQYSQDSNTKLANAVSSLPEAHRIMGWFKHKSKGPVVEPKKTTVTQENKDIKDDPTSFTMH